MLVHTLAKDDDASSSISHLPRSESPTNISDDDYDDRDSDFQFGKRPGGFVDGLPLEEDDEKTVYGSTNPSRLSTMKNGASMRRRFGRAERADVETAGPIQKRFAGVEEDDKATNNARNRKLLRELKRGDRVNVKIQPLCLFLFRDGTVISIHKGELRPRIFNCFQHGKADMGDRNPDNTLNFTAPITERLRQRDTGLRTTADPSLLMESLIDLGSWQ